MQRVLVSVRKKLFKAGFTAVSVEEKNGAIRLSGELSHYGEILQCGKIAVDKRARGVINDIVLKGHIDTPMRVPPVTDQTLEGATPDVLIVGGGIVGCAIARELSKYRLNILLVEKEYDIATGQSARNDGEVHPGIDLKPNSVKVKYNVRGNRLYHTLSEELGVPVRWVGQYVLFTARKQRLIYPIVVKRGQKNGIPLALYSAKQVAEKIPNPGYPYGALFCPSAGITCPYQMAIAFAENAAENGVKFSTDTAVLSMENDGKQVLSVLTNRGRIYPKVVVNAAGVFSDKIAEMAGDRFFTIHPRRGVEAILDKKANRLTDSVVGKFALRSSSGKDHTKGGGTLRTVDDNILIGPSATETIEREDESTTRRELDTVLKKQRELIPNLKPSDIITYFAGTRAATYEEEFIVEKSPVIENFVQAAGIQSPGITAAPAIAEDIAKFSLEILEKDGKVARNEEFNPIRKPIPCVKELSAEERNKLIQENPDYGVIICRCEEVSKGEILDAVSRPVGSPTVDGIKRRVRAGMGRCQGGFCAPIITKLIAEKTGKELLEVTKKGVESKLLLAFTKERDGTV